MNKIVLHALKLHNVGTHFITSCTTQNASCQLFPTRTGKSKWFLKKESKISMDHAALDIVRIIIDYKY